jgi:hypothetical protein
MGMDGIGLLAVERTQHPRRDVALELFVVRHRPGPFPEGTS